MELWGGVECTINRVHDTYFSQLERNGHATREDDIERLASLNMKSLRYPVLWERIAPDGLAQADWSWTDARLPALRAANIRVIAGLLHHGSGPSAQGLLDPELPVRLAEFAGAVAERYPWIDAYTPVNEPNTTARFSGLYGVWHPHARDDRAYLQMLFNQCRAVVLSMRAIREVNPQAKLVQTDDLGKTQGRPKVAALADFYNERRWLSWDLLCGKVVPGHALWDYIVGTGMPTKEILWFASNPCPPDTIGINYYITSERWLDDEPDHFPAQHHGEWQGKRIVDIEAVRVLETPLPGIGNLVDETWRRYGLPIAITEVHMDAFREDQIRWICAIWNAAQEARARGVELQALTVWALFGSFDWNSLVTEQRNYYEPGAFDVRAPIPRPTAVAHLMRELGNGKGGEHPVLNGLGWWRRTSRFLNGQSITGENEWRSQSGERTHNGHETGDGKTVLIVGSNTPFGAALARICRERHIAHRLFLVAEIDFHHHDNIVTLLCEHRAWAMIVATDYGDVDSAEHHRTACMRENVDIPVALAQACAAENVRFASFSTDLVFDGMSRTPYVESDAALPINFYGSSKHLAEQKILAICPAALVIRCGPTFTPGDPNDFLGQPLRTLAEGRSFSAANDLTVTPTYLPDLLHACLELLIDGESGLLHLANKEPLTHFECIRRAAQLAGIDTRRLASRSADDLDFAANRPHFSALESERVDLMLQLDIALDRYVNAIKPGQRAA